MYIEHKSYIYHNFREGPLKIKTNSKIGSDDHVCIGFKNDPQEYAGLHICITFSTKVYIVTMHMESKCNMDFKSVNTVSQTQDRNWEVHKTASSFKVTGNDIEPVELEFAEINCGEIAKRKNFGWHYSQINLGGISSAFYSTEKPGQYP